MPPGGSSLTRTRHRHRGRLWSKRYRLWQDTGPLPHLLTVLGEDVDESRAKWRC